MKQIKSRSLSNPAHVRSLVSERAWKRISASGVAWGLQGLKYSTSEFHDKRQEHIKTWSKELLEERNAILGKFRLNLGEALDYTTIPINGHFRHQRIGTDGHERDAWTIEYSKDMIEFVGHTKWHMNESDESWLKYFPAILAELDWMASKQFWKKTAEVTHPSEGYHTNQTNPREGFVLRRIRSVPSIVRRLVKMVGVQDSDIAEFHGDKATYWINPNRINEIGSARSRPVNVEASLVLGKGERNKPKNGAVGFAHMDVSCSPSLSWLTDWKDDEQANHHLSGEDRFVNIDLRLDITQPVGRTFARKLAKLVNEYRSKEEA